MFFRRKCEGASLLSHQTKIMLYFSLTKYDPCPHFHIQWAPLCRRFSFPCLKTTPLKTRTSRIKWRTTRQWDIIDRSFWEKRAHINVMQMNIDSLNSKQKHSSLNKNNFRNMLNRYGRARFIMRCDICVHQGPNLEVWLLFICPNIVMQWLMVVYKNIINNDRSQLKWFDWKYWLFIKAWEVLEYVYLTDISLNTSLHDFNRKTVWFNQWSWASDM